MQYLPLKVSHFDRVTVGDGHMTNPGTDKQWYYRRTKAPRPDDQHLAVQQGTLSAFTESRDIDISSVTLKL